MAGKWTVLRQENECKTVPATGSFGSFSVNGTRKRLDPSRYCRSSLVPSHAELKLGACHLVLRVSYLGMWHTLELGRDPPCEKEEL